MARTLSAAFKSAVNSVQQDDYPVVLLEIDHPALTAPIRVVNDNVDLVSNGQTYVAMAFKCTLPDDLEGQLPQATLTVDNVGKEMMSWLELSNGGQGATCTMSLVLRSNPGHIEWSITLNLTSLTATPSDVSGKLGFDDFLNKPGVAIQYRPDTAPGLF